MPFLKNILSTLILLCFATIAHAQPAAPTIEYISMSQGEVGASYSGYIYASNLAGLSIESGNLPAGLSFSSQSGNSHYITGTPTEAGIFTFTVKATNEIGYDEKEFTMVISTPKYPAITTTSLSNGEIGVSYYTYLYSASGSAVWSIIDGTLPNGLSLSNNNRIEGTPQAAGEFTITVKATNCVNVSDTRTFTISIKDRLVPTILTETLPNGKVDVIYNIQLESASLAATWNLIDGSTLPPGLGLYNNGIYGTPQVVGEYTFTLQTTNSAGYDEKEFTIVIEAAQPPIISTETLGSGEVNRNYSTYIQANESVRWEVIDGSLPTDLSLNYSQLQSTSYNYIYGTPQEAGEYTFTIKATNNAGLSATKTFSITVAPMSAPIISTFGQLSSVEVGMQYGTYVYASSWAEWSIESGSLPSGLSIVNNSSGSTYISGTPTVTGTFTFTIKAENQIGSDTKSFTIIVTPTQVPYITTTSLPDGEVGVNYYANLSSVGSSVKWSIVGTLPDGLQLYGNIIEGYTQAGNYTFTAVATNSIGESDSREFTISIKSKQDPKILTESLPNGKVGVSYSVRLESASQNTTWSLVSGSLPRGLNINNGYDNFSGTPQESGTFTFTIKAQNSFSSNTKEFTLVIQEAQPPVILTESLPNGVVGINYDVRLDVSSDCPLQLTADLPSDLYLEYWSYNYVYISGSPTQSGDFTFTITATDQCNGLSATKEFTINILPLPEPDASPVILTTSLPNGEFGRYYNDTQLQASSSCDVVQWSVASGSSLPSGFNIYSSYSNNGRYTYIFGTPSVKGIFTFTLKATDQCNGLSTTKEFTIEIVPPPAPTISTLGQLSSGEVGANYGTNLYASSWAEWSVEAGLPNGLSIQSNGNSAYISGTPTEPGTFTFTVKAENENGTVTKTFTIVIEPTKRPVILTSYFPNGEFGSYYSRSLESTSGTVSWSVSAGSLPSGISIIGNYIEGTPTVSGTYTFTLKAENDVGESARDFTIYIAPPSAPVITTATLPNGAVGVMYGDYYEGARIYSSSWAEWSFEGEYPPGLSIGNNGSSVYISGYPTRSGIYTFTIKAENETNSDTKEFTIEITAPSAPPTFEYSDIPQGEIGADYSGYIYVYNGAELSVVSGALPDGLSFTNQSGNQYYISGTPTVSGTFRFTVEASNELDRVIRDFAITIRDAQQPIILTNSLPSGEAGKSYYADLESASLTATWSVESGELPSGLSLYNYGDGRARIDGYPENVGSYTLTLKAQNSVDSDTKEFTIVINEALPPVIHTENLPSSAVGWNYFGYIGANEGVRWEVIDGTLPTGLSLYNFSGLSSENRIEGIPSEMGEYTFTIRATNNVGLSSTKDFTINIFTQPNQDEPPIIAVATMPNGAIGSSYYQELIAISSCNVQWSVTSGSSLPSGLRLDYEYYYYPDGRIDYISGQPNVRGTFTFSLTATDQCNGLSSSKEFTIEITPPPAPSIATTTLPNGEVGASYYRWLQATSFATWSLIDGALPSGLSLSSYSDGDGLLQGTPTEAGTFTFTVKAENETGSNIKEFTLVIDPLRIPIILTSYFQNGEVGSLYGYYSLESTSGTVSWSVSEGSLPPGISISENYIGGYPTTSGTYTFTLKAENSAGDNTKDFTIYITPPSAPVIVWDYVPEFGRVGESYGYYGKEASFQASSWAEWSIESGALPNGLYIESDGRYAYINGSPTRSGEYTFKVKAENEAGTAITEEYTITIEGPSAPPTFGGYNIPQGEAGASYSGWIYVSVGAELNTSSVNLPEGLSLEYDYFYSSYYENRYRISGIPAESGTFQVTVEAWNERGTVTGDFSITIRAAQIPTILTKSLPSGEVGKNYYADLESASQFAEWSVVGSLPQGLSLYNNDNGNARIEGYPAGIGVYTFTLRTENSAGSPEKEFTIEIKEAQPPVIQTASLPSGTFDRYYYAYINANENVRWEIIGNLPNGLSFHYEHYEGIEGTPTKVGEYTFTVKATNDVGLSSIKEFTINILPQLEPDEPPVITTADLPNGAVGSHYNGVQLKANSYCDVQWNVASGSLPEGLYLSREYNKNPWGGREYYYDFISGTPNLKGEYTFTLSATDECNRLSSIKEFTITIDPPSAPPEILNWNIPEISQAGENWEWNWYYVEASSWAEWSVEGDLPPGLSLNGEGERVIIVGSPTTSGEYTFTIKAENEAGFDTEDFTVTITAPPAPTIYAGELEIGEAGAEYWEEIWASIWVEWSFEGDLPPGLSLNSEGERVIIVGSPTTSGEYTFTIKAENETGSDEKDFTIVIEPAKQPTILTSTLRNGELGKWYSAKLESASYSAEWSVVGLPSGLSLYNYGYGEAVIEGYPEDVGEFTFTLKTENSAGSDTKQFTIEIKETQPPIITTPSLLNAEFESNFYVFFQANEEVRWELISGKLPNGLNNNLEDYGKSYIGGIPTEIGSFTFTVKATNNFGLSSIKTFTLVIEPVKKPTILTETLPNGERGFYYGINLESTSASAEWSVDSGNLPLGLWLYSDGDIWGSPEEAGEFTFTVRAQNSAGNDTKTFTITVTEEPQAPVIITETLPNGKVGENYQASIVFTSPSADIHFISGRLPIGVEYKVGVFALEIFGIPEEAGTFKFTVKAENSVDFDTKEFTLVIEDATSIIPVDPPLECAEGEEEIDGECKPKVITPTCSADEELVGNECKPKVITPTCSADEELVDGECKPIISTHPVVDPPLECAEGEEEIDGECKSTPIISHRANPSIGGIGVQTIGNNIVLTNLPTNAKVEVYNLNGKRVYFGNPENQKILKIQVQTRGMYIVKVGSQKLRVTVR